MASASRVRRPRQSSWARKETAIPESANKLLLWGAGGHAKVMLDVARSTGLFREVALLDDDGERGRSKFAGCAVLGGAADIPALVARGFTHVLVCIGDNKA